MKKAIVVLAVGSAYGALFKKVAPTFEHYAVKHGWEIKVVSELPDWFRRQYSRPGWDFRLLCCAYKLYQPSLFADHDLLAIMDPDMVINPHAPCLSSYGDAIPEGGLAAVQDVSYSERSMFSGWRRYHYADFMEEEDVARLPIPETHINSGLLLLRPSEVMEELARLNDDDSPLSDEDRINLRFVQTGRALLLPTKWNTVYPYELARRGYRGAEPSPSRFRIVSRVKDEWNIRVTQQELVMKLLPDVYVLHFASADKRIPLHLRMNKVLSVGQMREES